MPHPSHAEGREVERQVLNPFSVLGIEPRFDLDLSAVEKQYLQLARALHPDRYVGCGPSERRAALEKALEVNEAWRTVRDPVRRAEALFRLRGVSSGDGHEPPTDPLFLMEMLEEQERIQESRNAALFQRAADSLAQRKVGIEAALACGFADSGADLFPLLATLGSLRYVERLASELATRKAALENPTENFSP